MLTERSLSDLHLLPLRPRNHASDAIYGAHKGWGKRDSARTQARPLAREQRSSYRHAHPGRLGYDWGRQMGRSGNRSGGAGGARLGNGCGMLVESPRCARILRTVRGSSIVAMSRIGPPQRAVERAAPTRPRGRRLGGAAAACGSHFRPGRVALWGARVRGAPQLARSSPPVPLAGRQQCARESRRGVCVASSARHPYGPGAGERDGTGRGALGARAAGGAAGAATFRR